MKDRNNYFFFILFVCIIIIYPLSAEESINQSSATLPLEEILKLYREIDKLKVSPGIQPPVKAVIHRIDVKGQLLEQAVDMNATISVMVLADKEWVTVPLFTVDSETNIYSLPEIDNAFFVHLDKKLTLITESKGVYTFTISFIKKAGIKEKNNTINISFEKASQSLLNLRFDDNYFSLNNNNIQTVTSDGVLIYPKNNTYHIEWEYKKKKETKVVKAAQPEIESMIKEAHASVISTLEGKMIIRILYSLLFTGEKTISFFIPETYTLEKVYINKIQHSFSVPDTQNRMIKLKVNPGRSGDQSGEVELILSNSPGNYLLSGTLILTLPKTTWPVHEMYFVTYLPDVFDYTCRGGSLTAIDSAPTANYTYQVPTPGKILNFHQYLITSSFPSVTLDYTINLDGNYFLYTQWYGP
ncbi:MAG: hypothetical protein JXB88_02525 [Spirochaetales bacterium]|nr:hypothetical protein [Spirochaetales bacterium]